MKNKPHHLLERFLNRSLRIAVGVAILILVFYFAASARDIATSTISFDTLSAAEFLSFVLFTVLAYLLVMLIWPISFGKEPINLTKAQSKGKEIKKRVLGFMKMWIRG
jgi:membrane protein implicated in regulation of membrane protease activity